MHTARQLEAAGAGQVERRPGGAGVMLEVATVRGRREILAVHLDDTKYTADAARAWLEARAFRSDLEARPAVEVLETFPAELRCGYAGGDAVSIVAQAAGGSGLRGVTLTGYTGVPMKLPGFYLPVVVDLETLRIPRQKIPLLRGHDPDRIAGHTESVAVEGTERLRASGVLSGIEAHTADLTRTAENGFPWQVSIGAGMPNRPQHVPAGETARVNGRDWPGPLLVARGAVLRELSLLPLGADGNTEAGVDPAAIAKHSSEGA